jgi:hypothetical protein
MLKAEARSAHQDPQDRKTSEEELNNKGTAKPTLGHVSAGEHLQIGINFSNFIAKRLGAQCEYWNKITQCQRIEDIAAEQNDYMKTISQDYAEQLAHLINASQKHYTDFFKLMVPSRPKT